MIVLKRCVFATALLLAGAAALAAPRTFSFVFSGSTFANSAKATGAITFEDTLLNNTFNAATQFTNFVYAVGGPELLALQVVVSGASAGNGSFGMAAFDRVEWQTNGTLNLDQQLIGQPTANAPWGTAGAGLGGDFNLFGLAASAPTGVAPFELSAAGGESMQLISMAPISAVPEPGPVALFAGGLALLAWRQRRPKRQLVT